MNKNIFTVPAFFIALLFNNTSALERRKVKAAKRQR